MAASLILVDASPRDPATGAAVAAKLAGLGGERPYPPGYRAGLSGLPRLTASLDFDGEQLGGGGQAQALELRWAPATREAWNGLAALFWTDAPVTVRIGPEGDALPPIAATGLVLEHAAETGAVRIALADAGAELKRALLDGRFAGTGGIEGPVEWAGRIRPRAWGRCFNVPGEVIDKANNIVCFGDPLRQWQAFDAVRDRGAAVAVGTLTALGWQGSAATTFAALQAAAPIAGGGVLAPSIQCAKWWTVPDALHADVRGESAGGYVETAAEVAGRLVAARSTLPFAAGAIAAAAAARPAPFGWRVTSDSATVAAELSELLAGVSLSWIIVDGAIDFRPWSWSASTRTARSQRATRRRVTAPVATRKLGYRRNQAPMARGDLAAIVFAHDVVYDDGVGGEAARATLTAAASTAAANATSSLAQLAIIQSNGYLDAGEKREVIQKWSVIDAERPGIVAQAAALGVSSATYQAAYTALATYLSGLSPAWNNTATDTAIVADTFNGRFSDLYFARQQLLNTLAGRAAGELELVNDGPVATPATVVGNAFVAAAGAWTAYVRSRQPMNGPCRVAFRLRAPQMFGGLSIYAASGAPTLTTIGPSVHWSGSGGNWSFRTYNNSVIETLGTAKAGVTFSADTDWEVDYNGAGIFTLLANGKVMSTHAATPADALYAAFAGGEGAAVDQVTFGYSADVTALNQVAVAVPPIEIAATSTGSITTPLPKSAQVTVSRGGVDVSASAITSYALSNLSSNLAPGGVAKLIVDNAAGSSTKGRLSLATGFTGSGTATLSVTVGGSVQPPVTVQVNVTRAAPTSGGGSASKRALGDPNSAAVSSTSYVEIFRVNGITVASGETLSAMLIGDYSLVSFGGNASARVQAYAEYSSPGVLAWTAMGAAVNGTNSSYDATTSEGSTGSITCSQAVTPSAMTYDVRLMAARSSIPISGQITFNANGSIEVKAQ